MHSRMMQMSDRPDGVLRLVRPRLEDAMTVDTEQVGPTLLSELG